MNYNETNLRITEQMLRTLIREEMRAVFVEAKLLAAPVKAVPQVQREKFLKGYEWIPVPHSSLIKEFAYSGTKLLVKFKSNNRTYQYEGVPSWKAAEMYDLWAANRSVGSYFLSHIKGAYPTV